MQSIGIPGLNGLVIRIKMVRHPLGSKRENTHSQCTSLHMYRGWSLLEMAYKHRTAT